MREVSEVEYVMALRARRNGDPPVCPEWTEAEAVHWTPMGSHWWWVLCRDCPADRSSIDYLRGFPTSVPPVRTDAGVLLDHGLIQVAEWARRHQASSGHRHAVLTVTEDAYLPPASAFEVADPPAYVLPEFGGVWVRQPAEATRCPYEVMHVVVSDHNGTRHTTAWPYAVPELREVRAGG